MRHPLDIVAMFAALWLLASMVLDALTPKELTAVMIGIAIGPAVVITAVFYYLRCPRLDFVVMFAALWLISDIGIAFISPTQLPHFLIALGFVPALLIGIVLHWQRFQRRATSGCPCRRSNGASAVTDLSWRDRAPHRRGRSSRRAAPKG
ncbi:protein-S-isoprenylcysteine O-methyltransferase Ste14 [Bradyrhizobium sp. LM4.3]